MTVRIRGPLAEWYPTLGPTGARGPSRLYRRLVLLVVLAGLLVASAAEAQRQLYVTNQKGEAAETPPDSIIVYQGDLSGGNFSFKRAIPVPSPSGLAITPDELFVANQATNSITVYDRLADGNLRLKRTIAAEGLRSPFGIVLADDELFVANQAADSITVYKRTADGDLRLDRALQGSGTGLGGPSFIAVMDGKLFVANTYTNSVTIYDQSASGDTRFTQILGGSFDPLVRASGLAVDGTNKQLFVAYGLLFGFSVNVYSRLESGEFTLERILSGPELDHPMGLAVDLTRDELIVANTSTANDQGSINRYLRTASGNTPPLPDPITGAEVFSPVGLALSQCGPFNYTLNNACDVAVAPDSFVTTTIRAELVVGSGTVIFRPVSGLPRGATASFSPETCRLPCTTTLTITTSASTPTGSTEITVSTDGVQDDVQKGCSELVVTKATSCRVVTPPRTFGPVSLTIVKIDNSEQAGDFRTHGSGMVTPSSSQPARPCDPPRTDCLAFDSDTIVTLTASADPGSEFAGWLPTEPPLCGGAEPCTIKLTKDEKVTAYFGTPQEAFIARPYLNVLRQIPATNNAQELIDALKPRRALVVQAFFDAFFDGPFLNRLSTLAPLDYVIVAYRAILGREPTPTEQEEQITQYFGPGVGNAQGLRRALIAGPEFQTLLDRVFPPRQ